MSIPATASRWLNWRPKTAILADVARSGPAKPSKPDSVGFDGVIPLDSPKIDAEPDAAELARASAVLGRSGVRLIELNGIATVGIWSDLDGPEVRAALRTFGSDRLPVRYLDGAGVPMRYKLRRVEGEPVPMRVLAEMERNPSEPWKVRDQMLKGWAGTRKGIPWAKWKARELNQMFEKLGNHGPGREPADIKPETILDGIEREATRRENTDDLDKHGP